MAAGQVREVGGPDATGLRGHIRSLDFMLISMAAPGGFNQEAARSDFLFRRACAGYCRRLDLGYTNTSPKSSFLD